jgi:hypothetical protein
MADAETDVKKAAELKLWLENRINQLQDEIERLRETLGYVDATLRVSTFKPAIELMAEVKEPPVVHELKQDKGGRVLATASVEPDAVTIEPKEGVALRQTTPPFKSFLMGKILQGMRSKDEELVRAGKLEKGAELRFDVEESNGLIGRVLIENYRDRTRLNEILNTAAWTFSRMLEK